MTDIILRVLLALRWQRQGGQGLVEYALILVLISIVAIVIMTTVGTNVTNVFTTVANTLTNP